MGFYFMSIPNFNSRRMKKNAQMIQLVNKEMHKLIFGKRFHKKENNFFFLLDTIRIFLIYVLCEKKYQRIS